MHLGLVALFKQWQYFTDQRLALGRIDPGLQQVGVGEPHDGGELPATVVRADHVDVQVARLLACGAHRMLEPSLVGRQRLGADLVLDHQRDDVAVVRSVHRRALA